MTRGDDAVGFAERVLAVLELGSFSATYKYALFNAILDLCIEGTAPNGTPPSSVTTLELAGKVIELYWPHAVPYEGGGILRQAGSRAGGQEGIVHAIRQFRDAHAGGPGDLLHRARSTDAGPFERLVRVVEWKLIEMPIPRLQVVGKEEDRFLYEYGWSRSIRKGQVSSYLAGRAGNFDNRLLLKPGVAGHLLRLSGILRPLVHREWAAKVAAMNGLPESRLEEFLFGVSRMSLEAVRGPLRELQSNRCFYCAGEMKGAPEVDHFIPWARYPDNGLDNLVAAHPTCNGRKRDFLAATEHVERWALRSATRGADLATIAEGTEWERDGGRSRAVAVASYSRLPETALGWQEGSILVPIDRERVLLALAGSR